MKKATFQVILPALVVGFATFLLYLPSLGSGFVYDAMAQVVIDNYIHDRAHMAEVVTFRVLGRDVLDGSRPVQLMSLMGDSLLWGRKPFGYHLTSNLIHASNAALLFLLMVRLMGGQPETAPWKRVLPALAALVFAFHPLAVEPVAEISSREDLLATFFLLAGMVLATEFARRAGRAAFWSAAGCVGALLLAAGAKETGALGPFLLAIYWLLYQRGQPRRRWAVLLASAFAVVTLFFAARFLLEPRESQIFLNRPTYLDGSLARVFELQPRIWAFLLTNIFWPLHLSADYMPQNVLWISLPAAVLGLLIFVLLQGWASWKSRLAFFGAAVFWAGLAPVSNFIPIYRFAADRYLYLPMAGMALFLGGVLMVSGRWRALQLALGGALLVLVALLGALSWQRQAVFANSLNLWRDTMAKSPASETAANNFADALLDAKDYEAALPAFVKAVQVSRGKNADAWAGLAITLEKLGRPKEAEETLGRAIALRKIYADPDKLVVALIHSRARAAVIGQIRARMPDAPP